MSSFLAAHQGLAAAGIFANTCFMDIVTSLCNL